jgi:hypothetical protein
VYKGEIAGRLGVVLDRKVLAAHHAVALEPLAAELLGGAVRGVGPLDGDAVVVRVLGGDVERVAADGEQRRLLGVEHADRRVDVQTLHVGRLDGEADASSAGVDYADVVGVLVVEGRVEDDLGVGLRRDRGHFACWGLPKSRPIETRKRADNSPYPTTVPQIPHRPTKNTDNDRIDHHILSRYFKCLVSLAADGF